MVCNADANDMAFNSIVDICGIEWIASQQRESAIRCVVAIPRTEIRIPIFYLDAPVVGKFMINAKANCPSHPGGAVFNDMACIALAVIDN